MWRPPPASQTPHSPPSRGSRAARHTTSLSKIRTPFSSPNAPGLALDPLQAAPNATQSLSRRATQTFEQADVNAGADTITLVNHGFHEGQAVDYFPSVATPIKGLQAEGSYY